MMSPWRTTLHPYQNTTRSLLIPDSSFLGSSMPLLELLGGELRLSEGGNAAEEQRVIAPFHLARAAKRTQCTHARNAKHQHRIDAFGTGLDASRRLRAKLDPVERLGRGRAAPQHLQQIADHVRSIGLRKPLRVRRHRASLEAARATRAASKGILDEPVNVIAEGIRFAHTV